MDHLLHIWQVDKAGAAKPLKSEAMEKPAPETGYQWIHLNALDPASEKWMTADPEIDSYACETMMSGDSRPRTIAHEDILLVNLRGVNLNEGSDVVDMVGIRFFVSKSRIISVERRPLRATADIAAQLKSGSAPKTPGGFMAWFALTMCERMGPTITELGTEVDMLEDQGDDDIDSLDRMALASLRRDVIGLKRYLAPQRDALNTLSLQNQNWITERDRLQIRSATDQTTRITEELDSIRERCAVIRDQIMDQRSETMNRNMMVLSVVAAIFLPLGLISGMMGINVGGMPWVDNGMGFWWVTGIVIGTGLLQLLIFKFLKWL